MARGAVFPPLFITESNLSTAYMFGNRYVLDMTKVGSKKGHIASASASVVRDFKIEAKMVIKLVTLTVTLLIGSIWGLTFPKMYAKLNDHAWTIWMLLPCASAIVATLFARDHLAMWVVLVMVVITFMAIVSHALIMGQRDKQNKTPPHGVMLKIVKVLPTITAALIIVSLGVGLVVKYL